MINNEHCDQGVPTSESEQERARSQIINEWELLQNERAKVHQEALRLSQERERIELERQKFIQAQVNTEIQKEIEKTYYKRSKGSLHKNNNITDEELLDCDSSIESVEGEAHKKVKKTPELSDAAKKVATRTLRDWTLKFDGDTEKASDFLDKLTDCQESSGLTFQQIKYALSAILDKQAGIWYRTEKKTLKSWKELEQAFIDRFIPSRDDEDYINELRDRTQGKNENMATFISKFKTIAEKLQDKLSENRLVKMALRVLHPEYQKYMANYMQTNEITDFKTLLELGKKYEQATEIRLRYTAPKTKDKMIMPEVAYEEKSTKTKIAAIQTSSDTPTPVSNTENAAKGKGGKKGKKKAQNKDNDTKEDMAAIATAGNNNHNNQQQKPAQQTQNQQQQQNSQQPQNQQQNFQPMQQQPRPRRQNNVQGGFQQQANLPFYPRMPGMPQFTTYPPQQNFDPYYVNQNQWQNNYRPRQQYNAPRQNYSQQYQRTPFSGNCTLCSQIGHKARACPQLGNRLVCFGCGTLDVTFPNCPSCLAKKNQAMGNWQQEGASAPTTSSSQ